MRRAFLVSGAFCAIVLVSAVALKSQDGPVNTGSGTVAKPRPTTPTNAPDETSPDLAPIPSKLNKKATPDDTAANFKVESNLVQIDVSVLDNRGNFIPNIPRGNFRVLEDDVPQQIKSFSMGEAPMTVALLVEFSAKWQRGRTWYQTLQAAYGFVSTLKQQDYIAVIAYDMHDTILSDFSQDRTKTQEALGRLRIPGFSESNLYDALVDTEERMKDIEGRKAIVLISSGVDTFSKLTFDKARKAIQEDGVPIYAIGLMQALRIIADGRMSGAQDLTFLQADNQMKTFAKETGGMSFFPRFEGEMPSVFSGIQQALRNQYQIGYSPTNLARDGKFRKIKIQLVNKDGDPLSIKDEKGKPIKYQIIAKAGYTAPRVVE
jgi:Ca-activated chloride channel family protein